MVFGSGDHRPMAGIEKMPDTQQVELSLEMRRRERLADDGSDSGGRACAPWPESVRSRFGAWVIACSRPRKWLICCP